MNNNMKTVTKRLNQVLAAMLTIVALAVGQRVMAETVTYTIDGNTEMNSNVEFIATASGSATGTASTTWTYATGTSASVSLPGGISLSFGTNKSSKGMAVQDVLQIEATSTNGGYITLSHDSRYIYHVTLKYSNGNTFHEAWNMTKSYTYRFQEIGVKYIVVEYASYIPITDAVISGLSDSYSVSNAAVEPTPTVTWHGTTLTKNTHYTLSYQDNTTAGTATVKATGSGKFSPSTSVSANYTLVWATYSVRFNKNNDNATGTMSDQTFYYTEQKNLTAEAFTNPTGYHFYRWTTNADGTGNSYTNGQSVSNLTAENGVTVDLYARWAPNSYTVTLDNQGATTAGSTEVTATYDAAMPAITLPTRTGYTFGGYYTAANGGGTKYYNADGTSAHNWNIVSATILYAQWTVNTYTVTLDNQGATTAGSESVTATYNAVMPTITVPTRTGYTFGGYYTAANGGGTKYYNADGTSAHIWDITSATTLYAQWTANTYTLRLHHNDGTDEYTDQPMTYDVSADIQSVTRTGYTLSCWTTAADGTGNSYTVGQEVSNLTAENDAVIDLYAQWTANTYTVTLDNQSATTAGSTEVTATFDAAMPAITVPTKTNYIFGGYYTEANGGGTMYYNADGTSANNWNIDGNTTLYARWCDIDWAIEYAGTKDDPYIISISDQFDLLAQRVNNGTGYSGKYFKLGNNITITTPVGNSSSRCFKGTFDGNGKTLTFNLTHTDGGEAFIAPFRFIDGATIKRLHTAGTITTDGKMAGGIVGDSWGTSTIQSCRSSVAITSSINGDGTHGGLVGRVFTGTLTITDCLFDGSITGANTDRCGGFVGWKEASLELNRCLQVGDLTGISNSGGSTFCRYNSGFFDFSTCYYKTAYGTVQGTQTSATGSDLQALLGSAWKVSGDNVVPIADVKNLGTATISGVDPYYSCTGSEIKPEPTVTNADGTELTKGTDYTVAWSGDGTTAGGYMLTITGTGSETSGYYGSQTVKFIVMDYQQSLSGSGTLSDPYVIGSTDEWELFVYKTASNSFTGKYLQLTNDISVSEMASTNVSYGFSGDFDGNGHKITLTLSCNDSFTGSNEQDQGLALFRFAGNGCAIHNLTVDGTITTVNKFAAGFISYITDGTSSNNKKVALRNCRSSVGIISTRSGDATSAGFVAISKQYVNLTLNNCLFDGFFQSSTATQFAGFVGWQDINGLTTITNSLVAPASIELTASNGNHKTFCRHNTSNNFFSLTNSYYRTAIGETQGNDASGMNNQSLKDALGYGWMISGDKVVPLMNNRNISIATVENLNTSYLYTGSPIEISYTVRDSGGEVLIKGTDYTETFSPATVQEPGHYTLTITGTGSETSGYYGSQTINFKVYQFLSGSGIETDPYIIDSEDDWELFVDMTAGSSLAGEFFRLDADISTSEMASTNESYAFTGNFDGNGHKITLTLNSDVPYLGANEQEQGLALLRFAGNGCTIRNLTVDGTITTVNKFAAGFISYITSGNIVLSNCRSSVSINSTVSGDATSGGFVAISKQYGNLTLNNCLFDGSFYSGSATQFAGFVGYQDNSGLTTITNSLVAPASIALGAYNGNHKTFCRSSASNNLSLTNSYYRTAIGTAQGSDASGMDNLSLKDALGYNWEISGDKVVPKVYQQLLSGHGTQADPFIIGSAEDWKLFVDLTASNSFVGDFFRLDADISTSEMASTSENLGFSGDFDGNGHKITLTLSCNVPYSGSNEQDQSLALFRHAGYGCTIHDLTVDGTITTVNKFAAGFISYITNGTTTNSKNIVLRNCRSSVSINSTVSGDATTAGFVALSKQYVNLRLEHCLFDGSFQSSTAKQFAGFVGWQDINGLTTITNSLVAPASIALTANDGNHRTFCRFNTDYNSLTLTNCYYHTAIGEAQGTQVYLMTLGDQISATPAAAFTYKNSHYYTEGTAVTLSYTGGSETLTMPAMDVIPLLNGFDNSSVIANNTGSGKNVVLTDRTLYKDGDWNTLCLPFNLAISGSVLDDDNVDVRTLSSTDFNSITGELTLTFTDKDAVTQLQAGKPYIIKWSNGSNLVNPTFTGVTFSKASTNVETTYVDFIGTTSPVSFTANDKTKLFLGAENKLYYPDNDMTVNACRAYFQLQGIEAGDVTTARLFFGDDEDTGIENAQRSTFNVQRDDAWYTLDGRKLDKKPTKKGMYIYKGKLVII